MKARCPQCGKRYKVTTPRPGMVIACVCGAKFGCTAEFPPGVEQADYRTDPPPVPSNPSTPSILPEPPINPNAHKFPHTFGQHVDHTESMLRRYSRWCGLRSAILQAILAVWTALHFAWVVLAFINFLFDHPRVRVGAYGTVYRSDDLFMAAMCCPFSIWVLLACPLAISAIVTLERNGGG